MRSMAKRWILGLAAVGFLVALAFAGVPADAPQPTSCAPEDATTALRERLTGTLWQWDGDHGEQVRFLAGGTVEHPGWTERGLVTSWRVIDAHTVLFRIEKGRRFDRYAILVFSPDFTRYRGFSFHGGTTLAESRPVPSEAAATSNHPPVSAKEDR